MLYQVHLAMSGIQTHNFSFSIKLPSGSSNTQIIADRNWQCRRTNHKLEVKSQLFHTAIFLLSQRWPLITSLTVAVKIASLALNALNNLIAKSVQFCIGNTSNVHYRWFVKVQDEKWPLNTGKLIQWDIHWLSIDRIREVTDYFNSDMTLIWLWKF
jgi:hypothetical protein